MKHYLVISVNNVSGIFSTDKKFIEYLKSTGKFKFWYEITYRNEWFGEACFYDGKILTAELRRRLSEWKKLSKL